MYLKKITTLKNLGRFRAPAIRGGHYERFTLFYGGNGRGKTTIVALLRSLRSGDPKPILRRTSFNATSGPEAALLLASDTARFALGAWSAVQPDLHIFDHQFVSENVHGGDQVDVEHRRNFYRIVVGPTGVSLAEEVDRLDVAATEKQGEIAAQKRVIEQHLPNGTTFEALLKIAANKDVEAMIATAKKQLAAIANADAVAKRKPLIMPALPSVPDGFEELLAKTAVGIAADAAEQVKGHLAHIEFHDRGEAWLAAGLEHVNDGRCPFCANAVDGNRLVDAYRDYFSASYKEFEDSVLTMWESIRKARSIDVAVRAENSMKELEADAVFWSDYCECGYAPPFIDRVARELEELFRQAQPLIDAKFARPLEIVQLSSTYIEAKARWLATRAEIEASATGFAEINDRIQAVKDSNATADTASVERELRGLEATMKRHTEPVASLCGQYETLRSAKEDLVKDKDAKKQALDVYDATIFGEYEQDINRILRNFGAAFQLARTGKNYVGKVPQSTYCLRFDTNDVDVTKTPTDDPGFDTTMSAGDKSTFALAFFLAQVKRDPNLADKLIVFDDPFTSLDDFRRAMTAREIVAVGGMVSQIIVLSHDKHFLGLVRSYVKEHPCLAMQLSSTANGSSIETWDIDLEIREGYLKDHMRLQEFAENGVGDAREMRTVMRPLLEQYIRYRFPNQVTEGKWLGEMLGIIREDPTHPLGPVYTELNDINAYTAPFHHDPNTSFNEDEVRTFARKTVAIVGGC